MFYTVYKITNKLDNNIYIGIHKTSKLDDGYMGSGKLITRAITKYGLNNFTKEIIFIFDNEKDMKLKETELVTEEFCKREDTYNICEGGQGGWSYVNMNNFGYKLTNKDRRKGSIIGGQKFIELMQSEQYKLDHGKKVSLGLKEYYKYNKSSFKGKKHTEEHKQYISEIMKEKSKGENNSQYGTMWITNGSENSKIKKVDIIPDGWYKGRVIR